MTEAQKKMQTQRIQQFEIEQVKISEILPNAPLSLHRHEHPRVLIVLSSGTMNIVEQDGATERHVWETGKSLLVASELAYDAADVNAGDNPIEVVVVELKQEK